MRQRKDQGFILIAIAIGGAALLGACGLGVDLGRMYIVKNELQTFADSAALTAALRLNAESSGITRAKDEVGEIRQLDRWHLSNYEVPANAVTVEFAQADASGAPMGWVATPGSAANYSFARVTARVEVPVYFLSIINGRLKSPVAARAIAGQLATSVPNGYFPFTPIAHSRTDPNFGFTKGEQYTLRWAASPKANGSNVCQGDRDPSNKWILAAESRGSDNRGFFGDQSSASLIWDQVANDAPVQEYKVGDKIILTGGAKSTVKDALTARINQDMDPRSDSFDEYRDRGHSRRIVTVPVTDPAAGNEVVGFARFFLLPTNNYASAQGNEPWCAEYIGRAAPEGSDSQGANTNGPSLTKVRLWE